MNRSERRQDAPEHRVGHADRPEAQPDDQAEARVDQGEHRQVAADPLADLVHRPGRQAHLALAEEPDDPVAQVLAVHQHEQDQDQDERPDPQGSRYGPTAVWSRSGTTARETTFTGLHAPRVLRRRLAERPGHVPCPTSVSRSSVSSSLRLEPRQLLS